ncbi:MAG TPA: hypothetical protein PLR24_01400 [Saprospiraceae bacterium]|nr:hypothetical protein [Candidatus Parvibacillus calidus]MBX2938224.1 hypothetical protein [Saprospiraceae bacterium]MBX7178905.1 hypothetical protein [Saprospiraceae bacterium]MCO5283946.1 hypothetical protein [Saprospiraceae bacterium]MCO6469734.1 hypothetical protein [Saprospiraceae bacterium]
MNRQTHKYPLILICLFLWVTLDAQCIKDAFVRIDTIELPAEIKNRLQIKITRFYQAYKAQSRVSDFTIVENYHGTDRYLKIMDIAQVRDTMNVLVHIDHISDQNNINLIIDAFNRLNQSEKSTVFLPTIIGDSLNFYKIKKFNSMNNVLAVNDFKQKRYSLDQRAIRGNLNTLHSTSCYIWLIDSKNIYNIHATIGKIFPNENKNKQAAPLFVPYLISDIPTSDYSQLRDIMQKVPCSIDSVIIDINLKKFHRHLKDIKSANFPVSYDVFFDPAKPFYLGENRQIVLTWRSNLGKDLIVLRDTATYSFGSSDFPVNVKELKKDSLFWFSSAFIGILFLLVLFFILSILYPKIEERKFFKEYVSPYKPVNNIIKLDNITNEPIKEGTLVVQRCKEVVPFYIWKSLGNQCPSYPECMDILGCDGCGKSDINYKFFSKSGSLKKYNWLFFGACGGFFAWVFTLLTIPVFHRIHLADLFQGLYEKKELINSSLMFFKENVINQSAVGFGIALGLAGVLTMVDYFSSIVRQHIIINILKIVDLAIVAALFFGLVNAFSYRFDITPFFSGLISWTGFALLFAITLSLKSATIRFKRALIASLMGVLITYLFFYISSSIVNIGYENTTIFRQIIMESLKILRFQILGMLIGYITMNVISRQEDYELELQSPDSVRGKVIPLTKALNTNNAITIGTSPKNVIRIKWIDAGAEEYHASINYSAEGPVLETFAEVIVNREYLPKGTRYILQDRDMIQLGRHSSTLFLFIKKYHS